MRRYLLRRIGLSLLLIWLVATGLFLFVHLLPGDPALLILGARDEFVPSASQIEMVRAALRLDRPLYEQYLGFFGRLLQGDLGDSFITGLAVGPELAVRAGRTLQLVVPALILSSLAGIVLGVLAAQRRDRWPDTLASILALVGFSLPAFVVGNLLVLLFAVTWRWLPSSGYAEWSREPGRFLLYMLLPVATLAVQPLAATMRMTRNTMLEQLLQDYVRTARSKGVAERIVTYRHALKNALMPVVTVIGLQVGTLLAGTVVVEYIFNWPGVNQWLLRSVGNRDYPVIQGVVLLVSVLFVAVNATTDLIYAFLNPRLRYE